MHSWSPSTGCRVDHTALLLLLQVCAYTLPCLFSLKLLGTSMCNLERCCCVLIIPVSLSAAGLYSSVHSLVGSIRSHRSGFGLAG